MIETRRILLVDDDQLFLEAEIDIMTAEGLDVAVARSAAEARDQVRAEAFGCIVLDKKLEGAQGPDTGLTLLEEFQSVAPSTPVIIATAYATDADITYAFEAGAWDYLQKDARFGALLRPKVRNALEVYRRRLLEKLDAAERRERLRALWVQVEAESDARRKGAMLEDLVVYLVETMPGFNHVRRNRRNRFEELDVIIRNESSDPYWAQQGPYLVIECKHWSQPVGPTEFNHFHSKVRRRFGQVRLAFFIAVSGFTAGFDAARHQDSGAPPLVVPIDGAALAGLVNASAPQAELKTLVDAALLVGG